jgi:hypothetical protein
MWQITNTMMTQMYPNLNWVSTILHWMVLLEHLHLLHSVVVKLVGTTSIIASNDNSRWFLLCHRSGLCALIRIGTFTCIWVVGTDGHTFPVLGYVIRFHMGINKNIITFMFIDIINVPIGKAYGFDHTNMEVQRLEVVVL